MSLAVLLLALGAGSPAPATVDEVLAAIRIVETGGEPNAGRHALGDGGRALGPFQITRGYWRDAGVPGRYEDCRDPVYARAVVLAYWKRWCPVALERVEAETLARVHNGGPRGGRKPATLPFWKKVRAVLASERSLRE